VVTTIPENSPLLSPAKGYPFFCPYTEAEKVQREEATLGVGMERLAACSEFLLGGEVISSVHLESTWHLVYNYWLILISQKDP